MLRDRFKLMAVTDQATAVDVSGARVFVEAGTPVAGGRWYRLADGSVAYERPNGERVHPAVVSAETLEHSPTWTEVTS